MVLGRAGSRRDRPGYRGWLRRGTGLLPSGEGLDDDHVAAAAWTGWKDVGRFLLQTVFGRWCDREKRARQRQAGFARGRGEQAVVTDAVEPARQDVEEEAADELVRGERHDLLAVGTTAAIVLVAEVTPVAPNAISRRFAMATRWV